MLRLRDLVYSFAPSEADDVVEAWLTNVTDDPARGWTRSELETHLREEYSTFSWLLEPMLERAGFVLEDVSHTASKVFSAYTCLKLEGNPRRRREGARTGARSGGTRVEP